MSHRPSIAILALAFLLPGATSQAQFRVMNERRIDTQGATPAFVPGTQRSANLSSNLGFVVVWTTRSSGPGGYDIRGRRIKADLRPDGIEFVANTYTTGRQYNQAIASDDAGNFVVIWNSVGQDGSDDGVFGQRFSASGARLGGEFQVNQTTLLSQRQPSVAMRSDGGFVVVWSGDGVFARRYDPSGLPVAAEFQVSTYTTDGGAAPSVDFDGSGNFVVVWEAVPAGIRAQRFDAGGARQGAEFAVNAGGYAAERPRVARAPGGSFVVAWRGTGPADPTGGIFAQRFDPSGQPLGANFLVNAFTTGEQKHVDLDIDGDGDFVAVWQSIDQDGSGPGIFGRRFDSSGAPRVEFMVNTYTLGSQTYPSVAAEAIGNYVVTWNSSGQYGAEGVFAQRYAGGMTPMIAFVDGFPNNGVLEPGETIEFESMWKNGNFDPQWTVTGVVSNFTGPGVPGDPTYTIVDSTANFADIPSGQWAWCGQTGNCYWLRIGVPTSRPASHWDASITEQISATAPALPKSWRLHVGDSFSDVPRSNTYYRFVETILHHNVTGGCTPGAYCPASPTTREQMAVFILVSKEGAAYRPDACTTPVFSDVPAASPFCPWIEELARRGVVTGCGGGNYCPTVSVSREQMAVFVLATTEPGIIPPPCDTPTYYSDVPATSPYCSWIQELTRRAVVNGCGGGAYCPTAPVTREEMSVFLMGGFLLDMYLP